MTYFLVIFALVSFLIYQQYSKHIRQKYKEEGGTILSHEVFNASIRLNSPTCLLRWRNSKSVHSVDHFLSRSRYSRSHIHDNFLEGRIVLCKKNIPMYINPSCSEYIHHFADFSSVYFSFFSNILWSVNNSCSHHLYIESSNKLFVELAKNVPKASKMNWITHLVGSVNRYVGYNTIVSEDKTDVEKAARNSLNSISESIIVGNDSWFYHPSDASLLKNIILQRLECPYEESRESRNYKVLVVDRDRDRSLLNRDEIVSYLGSSSFSNPLQVSGVRFTNQVLQQQVDTFDKADIIIAIHGAALTNVAFMKPCSVLIEIFPFAFRVQMYEVLARNVDVGYFTWGETEHNCVYKTSSYSYCKQLLHSLIPNGDVSQSAQRCTNNFMCRGCYRDAIKIRVNKTMVYENVQKAINHHKQCVASHPYYFRA